MGSTGSIANNQLPPLGVLFGGRKSCCDRLPFRTLGLDARILKAVQEAGYTEPTPIQAAAVPLILAGHDLIGIAQTGTGRPQPSHCPF